MVIEQVRLVCYMFFCVCVDLNVTTFNSISISFILFTNKNAALIIPSQFVNRKQRGAFNLNCNTVFVVIFDVCSLS